MNLPSVQRTRVKICGITREQDALNAVAAGVDALGFVLYAPSPRAVSVADAASIVAKLPAFICPVALFVNPSVSEVEQLLAAIPHATLQFHGDESLAFCRQFKQPFIKALRIKPEDDVRQRMAEFDAASGLLLDAWHPALYGGTGEVFDWSRIPADCASRVLLAGGLTPDNVTQAIQQVRPYAVDVSGGVEASKGIKDSTKIFAFMAGVQAA